MFKRLMITVGASLSLLLTTGCQAAPEVTAPVDISSDEDVATRTATPSTTTQAEEPTYEIVSEPEPDYTDPETMVGQFSVESMWDKLSSEERTMICENQDLALVAFTNVMTEDIEADGDINLEDPEGFKLDREQEAREFYAEACHVSEAQAGDDGIFRYPDNLNVPFGETYEWTLSNPDGSMGASAGVRVHISAPSPYSPTDTAAGGETFSEHVMFTITVTNDSHDPLDLILAMSDVQSGTREADRVFDSAQGLQGTPSTTLLPGRSVEWVEGYGVDDPDDIVFSFAPTWDHGEVYFTTEP